MGSLPAIKRFAAEDYPTQGSWIGPLLYSLNLLLTTIYSNLNNGLSISQNMQAAVNTLTVNGQQSSTSFTWKFSKIAAPIGVQIVQCLNGSIPVPLPQISWSYSSGSVLISSISGLTPGINYTCTFITWGA